ncbi:glycerol-3-phosphate dehydrogenase [Geothermobacter ehrlichii]|uniref:Glycerol-3-phosphate dehydrogenase n=1 Tax=Geothermobacter ehrlichii TaxID=213224 RepID=A0A5D3WLI0_9BACT|nr:glycerol-3-phosphate dehydrogenase/oxidase [Geothermobacter ehrlichii]TYO99297.1 glycerol-3-phosphate dehydrogenase [Geothermobacter ehrlichii]
MPVDRAEKLHRLQHQSFDVLIIGGGITGAGIARELALRGLKVALVDKGDFAGGTSSRSTKLIHAGLRYLEGGRLGLVHESCRERRLLQKLAPHLVRPLPFLIPGYRGDRRPFWMIRAGLTLYDLLALGQNARRHQLCAPGELAEAEPCLKQEGLVGAARYWDCRMDDARLCLENILAAENLGAVCLNHVAVEGLIRRGSRIGAAAVRDLESGRQTEVAARMVVNAAGPWLDRVRRLAGLTAPSLRPTRGTHILVPRINRREEAFYLSSGRDDRLFFVIPWGEMSLIGTTDVDFDRSPDLVSPVPEDITYLIEESNRRLRDCRLRQQDVIAAFAGLRPLVRDGDGPASRVSREYRILQEIDGLLSVAGGKYTTYRALAARVGRLVCRHLGWHGKDGLSARVPLPGGAVGDFAEFRTRWTSRLQRLGLGPEQAAPLVDRYGARVTRLEELLLTDTGLCRPLADDSPLLTGEVVFAARFEAARTPGDILRRRTTRALEPGQGLADLEATCRLLAAELGVGPDTVEQWKTDYLSREICSLPTDTGETDR